MAMAAAGRLRLERQLEAEARHTISDDHHEAKDTIMEQREEEEEEGVIVPSTMDTAAPQQQEEDVDSSWHRKISQQSQVMSEEIIFFKEEQAMGPNHTTTTTTLSSLEGVGYNGTNNNNNNEGHEAALKRSIRLEMAEARSSGGTNAFGSVGIDDGASKFLCCLDYNGPIVKKFLAWPRTTALFLGVILPLWLLIALSFTIGNILARVEAPTELESNDASLAAHHMALKDQQQFTKLTMVVPALCLELYYEHQQKNHTNTIEEDDDLETRLKARLVEVETIGQAELVGGIVNATDLQMFMSVCGQAAEPISEKLLRHANDALLASPGDLSFNWIRCTPHARGSLKRGTPVNELNDRSLLRYEAQDQHFRQVWEEDQNSWEETYLQENLDGGMEEEAAKKDAFERSTQKATGESGCSLNTSASVWFWFTVASTIGYGNQAPVSAEGRALTYTVGFISMLIFGVILTAAGHTVSVIVDAALTDMFPRYVVKPIAAEERAGGGESDGRPKPRRKNQQFPVGGALGPEVQSIFWGVFYYGWMVVLAAYTQYWKNDRLGPDENATFADMYWFSYITTTTVGLGDIFLEPEVMQPVDLIVFPVLFLMGFTLLSAFLSQFTHLLVIFLGRRSKSTVALCLDKLRQKHRQAASGSLALE